jgi:plastocyanin
MAAMKLPPCLALLALTTAAFAGAAELTVTTKGGKGEMVADAVVTLIPLDAPVPPPDPAQRNEVAQQNQEYTSYVTIVQAGSKVYFPNKDTVQHHVYSLSQAKKFELPLYNPGRAESFVFDVSGVVTLGCNIHDWMLAYLVVVPTPWFGKTDGLGATTITAPAGRYRLQLWHPRMTATITEEITLPDSKDNRREFTVTLKPDRRIRRGPAGKTSGYR